MKFLFDASSVFEIIKTLSEEAGIQLLSENCMLDLTKYETANALWREHVLQRAMGEEIFEEALTSLQSILSHIGVLTVDPEELLEVARIAAMERITFYDASYISVAKFHNLMLITEDEELRQVASRHTKAGRIKDIKPVGRRTQ